jgi:acyl-CoA thioester hydrolase
MEPVECYRGVIHPWQCDAMGHFTTRFYMAMFDDAAYHLLAAAGFTAAHIERGIGFADLKTTLSYLAELKAGDLVLVKGAVVKMGTKSLTAHYRMFNLASGDVAAEMEAVSVQFDLRTRKAIPIQDDIRAKLAVLLPAT